MNIILLHGLAGSKQFFSSLEDSLRKLPGVSTLSFDLLGFGENKFKGNNFTLEEHLNFIDKEIRTRFSNAPIVLIGHSMGGILALHFATSNRMRVEKLILMNTPLGKNRQDVQSAIKQQKSGWGYWIQEHPLLSHLSCQVLCQAGAMKLFWGFKPKYVSDEVFRDYRKHTWKSVGESFKKIILEQPAFSVVTTLGPLPILNIIGRSDAELSRRSVNVSHVTNIELLGGHYSLAEFPDNTIREIKRFLNLERE